MNFNTYSIRHGYDKKKCLVHARCCETPGFMIATAQYLDVAGSDLFTGILMSQSFDGGKTWSEFKEQEGLYPIVEGGGYTTVGCDGTPMYHKKTGKVLLLGHTARYKSGELRPCEGVRYTFYSVFDDKRNAFSKIRFLNMPEGFENSGNGCGQSVELPNGEILIPIYYYLENDVCASVSVLRCSFDGENLKLLEIGNILYVPIPRGLGEPSIIFHNNKYYMCIRNYEAGFVAESDDGMNYYNLGLLKWEDDSIVQNYNTQQHWLKVDGDLYLAYTRRGANNDHVFRHRAPIFIAKFENMRIVKETETAIIPEKGARLGNFGCTELLNGKWAVMAAEWMQPAGCEKYGSDNNIYLSFVE